MELFVDPKWEWPLHDQLIRQLRAAIEDGDFQDGERLPSVRELAAVLRIHRNTVVRAYSALEDLGYVTGQPGKGFFACPPIRTPLSGALQTLMTETLERLQTLGEDPVVFAKALLPRAMRAHARRYPHLRIAVVECSIEQATLLAQDLSNALQVSADPLVLDALGQWDEAALRQYTLLVTTFQHVEEVQRALPGLAASVMPGLLTAHLKTLRALEKVPQGGRVGVACVTWEGTKRLTEMVQSAGFAHLKIIEATSEDPKTLPMLLEDTQLIIAATKVAEILQAFAPNAPIVVDDRTFTEGSLLEIRARLDGLNR